MPHLIKITNDLFDIAWRLKGVNANYVLYYNASSRRFEVYDGDNYAFAVPYPDLDGRAVDYARKTARQNADKIFEEIERNNQAANKQAVNIAVNNTINKLAKKEVL